ncbi:hypothetical protein [Croceibacterium aestuarii]|uniref:hypothetical protein n=1 Tax=Croceibacterium aestuarii TaxID=3064139 RepID=UPI00272DE204|nr:hypothetical protein [Croceibacterium sp. D39]
MSPPEGDALTVRGAAEAGLLARVIGVFAQLGIPAPALQVEVVANVMEATLDLERVEWEYRAAVYRKVSGFVGVDFCEIRKAACLRDK